MKLVIDIPEGALELLNTKGVDWLDAEHILSAVANGTPLDDVLDKTKGYVEHIRNTGMGKKKSLNFIEKYIEGLKAESEDI